MSDVFRTVTAYARFLTDGDYDAVIERYSLPFIVRSNIGDLVIETPEVALQILTDCRSDLLAIGTVDIDVCVASQIVTDDGMAFVVTRSTCRNRAGAVVRSNNIAYVLRQIDGEWKIIVITSD